MKKQLLKITAFLLSIIIAVFLPLKAQLTLIPYEDGIYKIYSPEHLNYLSIAVQNGETTEEKTFHLMKDIDMKNIDNFVPIDLTSGNFNGNNHKILNLSVSSGNCGVFIGISYSTVENLTVENGSYIGEGYIGGLAAGAYNSTIRNVHTKNVYCEATHPHMGGLIGSASYCNIVNCSSFAILIASDGGLNAIGGFIGVAYNCRVSESYSKGDIFNLSTASGFDDGTTIGGFMTTNLRNNITNCYSHVDIVSYQKNTSIGGFVAMRGRDTIINCYAMPTIFDIYSNPNISIGLFINQNGPESIINNCFYTTEISGYDGYKLYPSYPVPILFSKSEAEMQSPEMVAFPGVLGTSLNFGLDDPIWVQDLPPYVNNGLPMLRWQKELNIEEKEIEKKVKVYPNPTMGVLNLVQERINNEQLTINNVEVFDIYGRKAISDIRYLTSEIGKSEIKINISHLPTGIYFVKITTNAGTQTQKIIKL